MKLALNDEKILILLIEKISFTNLKEVSLGRLEESVKKLTSVLIQGSNVTVILNFLRNLLTSLNANFSQDIYQLVYDSLLLTASNKELMKSEDMADLNFLLGFVKGKLNQEDFYTVRSHGYSKLINSFSNNN